MALSSSTEILEKGKILPTPLPVYCFGDNQCAVWDGDVAYTLRVKYRIVGALVGTLPNHNSQNKFFSLPLLLLPEEVTLCLEKGWVYISSQLPPDPLRVRPIITKKEREKEKEENRKSGEETKKRGREEDDSDDFPNKRKKEETSTDGAETSNCGVGEVKEGGEWTYPATEKEKMKYVIYRDCWERGFFITFAVKFGGHFLLYPGDPLMFHAQFIVLIVDSNFPIPPTTLVSFSRLGVGTKKSTVLACASPLSPLSPPSSIPPPSPCSSPSLKDPSLCESRVGEGRSPQSWKCRYITLDWQGSS